jgi:4,5-dihydroxyphthalate decarboxylase
MHVVAMRRELYERNRWLAESLAKAFELAKQRAYERMRITSNIYSLPWLHLEVEEMRRTFSGDPYVYGVESNRTTLEAAALYSYEQGLGERQVAIEEMFAPETLDVFAEAQ